MTANPAYDSRVHFTPIWYPDADYVVKVCFSDIWTPMGMIRLEAYSDAITIDGNMYDDWWIN